MLRSLSRFASSRTSGRVLTTCLLALFTSACGGQLGELGRLPSAPPIAMPTINLPGIPGFGGSQQAQSGPQGVIAAPDTEWGFVSAASDGFAGLVVSDEPRATLVGRDILSRGGNAADAATAVFFTLAATNPAGASVGGGGICLVHDSRTGVARSVDFLPRAPREAGPIAVPGAVRGFGYIQAEYGNLNWATVVEPGSDVAAGHPVSRTLARRILAEGGIVQLTPSLRRMFTQANGRLAYEGVRFSQPALAGTIAIIAARGPQDFYTGELSQRVIEEATEQGGTLSIADLQGYEPNVSTPQAIELDNRVAFLPTGATGAGFFFPELTQKALRDLPVNRAPGTPAASALNRNAQEVLVDAGVRGALLPDYGSSSFAVTDSSGLTVVCGVTLNGPFGSLMPGRSTGALFAQSPLDVQHGLAGAFVTPIVVTNASGNRLHMAAGSAGGPQASASLLYTALNVDGSGLQQALQLNGSSAYGTVNAISCGRESEDRNAVCRIGVDPRGSGLGAEALAR